MIRKSQLVLLDEEVPERQQAASAVSPVCSDSSQADISYTSG
jgi:hypothetical protein